MKSAQVEALGSLRAFQTLSPYTHSFSTRAIAKDAIEASGVPHVEVDRLLINGKDADFTSELNNGDLIEIRPHALSKAEPSLVRQSDEPRIFIVDENSARLARHLLLLGFDTRIDPAWNDAEIATRSAAENRVVVTRDIGLLKRSLVTRGYFLRSDDPKEQTREVIHRFDLWPHLKPFSRCSVCNVPINEIKKTDVRNVAPATLEAFDEFFECSQCQRTYWKGSHYDRMQAWLAELAEEFGG